MIGASAMAGAGGAGGLGDVAIRYGYQRFDTAVMAATVQRAVDGIPFLLERVPDTDLGHYADELVALFDLATRA